MTTGTSQSPGKPILRIYVAPGCAGCRTALALAGAVRHAHPGQPVEVIDLTDQPEEPLPPAVIGTPAYVLGDEVISLGNPELSELLNRLDTVTATRDDV